MRTTTTRGGMPVSSLFKTSAPAPRPRYMHQRPRQIDLGRDRAAVTLSGGGDPRAWCTGEMLGRPVQQKVSAAFRDVEGFPRQQLAQRRAPRRVLSADAENGAL